MGGDVARAAGRRPGVYDVAVFVIAAVAVVVAWLWSDRSVVSALDAFIAFGSAGLLAYLVPRNPIAAVGVVVLLAPLDRLALELPLGTMRVEQPAIAALVLAGAIHARRMPRVNIRPAVPLLIAVGVYVAVLTVSSLLVAPQPVASLRIVAWTILSMAGGVMAGWLTVNRPEKLFDWFIASGVITALLGLAQALLILVTWPQFAGQRATALAHEPNLYAIFLAATVPFAAERFRRSPGWATGSALTLILIAIGVGGTRSAYIALAIALIAYVVLVGWQRTRRGLALRVVALWLIAGITGAIIAPVLLTPPPTLQLGMYFSNLGPPSGGPGASAPPDSRSQIVNLIVPVKLSNIDTLEFRMQRIPPAIDDFKTSPVIGLGAYSFEQLHALPNGAPDHIAILAVAVPYESGILGAVALAVFFVLLLLRLLRTARSPALNGLSAAYIAAILVLLISYEATNAFHFAFTWLILGPALGLTLVQPRVEEDA